MLQIKKELPDESELVLCTVSKVQNNAVFVHLNQYNKQGMLHISEISPGRIRNIRDFVKEGKTIVCKVLSVNEKRGHIDVSFRRVSESQRVQFNTSLKQQQTAEKIIEQFAKEAKLDAKEIQASLQSQLDEKSLFDVFSDFAIHDKAFTVSALNESQQSQFFKLIKQRIKPPRVEITGKFTIQCYDGDAISILTKAFQRAKDVDEKVDLRYSGNGLYSLRVEHESFKAAEDIVKQVVSILEGEFAQSKDAVYSFTKADGKTLN